MTAGNSVRYDTIQDAILTCARNTGVDKGGGPPPPPIAGQKFFFVKIEGLLEPVVLNLSF